jgi:2-keto-4-pentenoate hydratase
MDARVLSALRRQLERRAALLDAGARHVGWKVGANIEEVGPPVFGYLTTATVVAPGGVHDTTGARELRAETELLIEVGDELRCGVALELVDVARPPDDLEGIVAANVFHRAVALGGQRGAGTEARLWIDGELRETALVTPGAAAVVRRLAEQLDAAGERLRTGDLVLAGSVIHVPAGPGCRVAAEIAGVDRVEVTLA